jgi:wobble nucleotide-excising tRNase
VTILEKLFNLFKHKPSQSKLKQSPLLIIKKDAEDTNIKEYNSIEAAIADLENDPKVPTEKIEKLKASIKMLKDKTSIKISNGVIIK